MELRRQQVTRYVTPLREGGSLPALAEADDGFKYVVKFRGAGHGTKALIAELIGGEVARALRLKVPELVMLDLDEDFGRTEGDEEIQDLLQASRGLNVGLHFLSGALTLNPVVNQVDERLASRIVWLDAFLTNVDRASLYFHHSWRDWEKAMLSPFPYIKEHALLRKASHLEEADRECRELLTPDKLAEIVDLVPDEWLQWDGMELPPDEIRDVYKTFLTERLKNSHIFLKQAIDARQALV